MAFMKPPPSPYWDPGKIVEPDYMTLDELGLNPIASSAPATGSALPPSMGTPSEQVIRKTSERDPGAASEGLASKPRDMTNNFGYVDRPSWMGTASTVAGMVSPMLGLGAKAVNLGINANNMEAVSEARKTLGLPDQSNFDKAKGVMRDNKGIVSENVQINDQNYPVGFEAETPSGRTTLTPNEARTRAATLGGMEETPDSSPEPEQSTGLLGGLFDEAQKTLSSIFSADDEPSASRSMMMQTNAFPAAPSPGSFAKGKTPATPANSRGPWGNQRGGGHDGTSYSGQNKGLDSPSEGGGRFGGSGLGTPSKSDKDKDRSV